MKYLRLGKVIAKLKYFENCIFLLVITVANFWFWQIFSNNFILGVILLVIELGLFILITKKDLKRSYTLALYIFILFLLVFDTILLKSDFDNTLLTTSSTEISILNERHGYLAEGLGNIFTNKYVQHYYKDYSLATGKYLRNIFYTLDPNLYFFRSHPREKAGIDEYEKYSPFVLPFFVIGILFTIIYYRKYKSLIIYSIFATFLTGFISPSYKLGPILMFPFINIILYLGFITSIQKIKLLFKI
jgi:hypothetical protein